MSSYQEVLFASNTAISASWYTEIFSHYSFKHWGSTQLFIISSQVRMMEIICTSSLFISYIHATFKALNFNCPSSGLVCIWYPTLVILAPADIVHVAHTPARPSVGTVQLTHLDVCSCDFSSLHDFWFHLVDLGPLLLTWFNFNPSMDK